MVEILLVVALLVLLSTLLLSVLSRVRNASHQATCASNLNQINMAIQMYTQDARGAFPPFGVSKNENCGWAEQIYPYTHSTTVFKCPSFKYGDFVPGCPPPEETNDDVYPFQKWDGSYDLNYFSGHRNFRATYLRNPGNTIILCDGDGGGSFFGEEESGAYDNGIQLNPRDFTKLGNRHNYGSNVCFVDGHTKWIKYEDLLDINLWKAH